MNQEPKYEFKNGRIHNRKTGEPIPKDEPVFILRARDVYASSILRTYIDLVEDLEHAKAVQARLADFDKFAIENPGRMKVPDTALPLKPY